MKRQCIFTFFDAAFGAVFCLLSFYLSSPASAEPGKNVSIQLEKKILLPQAEISSEPIPLTRIAWGGVANQIVASAFSSRGLYLIDAKTDQAIRFDSGLDGIAEPVLLWSHLSPLLVASRDTRVRVFESSKDILQKPSPTLLIENVLPRPLLTRGASLVEKAGEELLVLGGNTNKKIDPSNPDVVAHSVKTGKKAFEWQFPNDGASYHISQSTAALADGHTILAAWVQRVVPGKDPGTRAVSAQEVWIINPERDSDFCRAFPLHGLPENVSVNLEQPSLSPNGKWLATAEGMNEYVHIYNTKDCEETVKLQLPGGPNPRFITFSPNGKWLLGTSPMAHGKREGRVYVWRTSDWKLVFEGVQILPYQAAFDRTSSRFAVATVGGLYIYRIEEH